MHNTDRQDISTRRCNVKEELEVAYQRIEQLYKEIAHLVQRITVLEKQLKETK